MTGAHHPDQYEAGAVIYSGHGKTTNRDLALTIVRGIGGTVDYSVAKNSRRSAAGFISNYGLELGIRASGAINESDGIPRVVFYGSVDGRKTAKELRKSGLEVPAYIEEIILAGDLQQTLYPPVLGLQEINLGKFRIFDFGNDVNAGPEVKDQARKLRLPLDRMLDTWDLEVFEES